MLTTPVLIPESLFGWCPSLFLNYSRLCNLFLHYYFFIHIFFDGSLIKHESFQSMNVLGLEKISTLMVRSGRAIGHQEGPGLKLMTNSP